MKIFGLIAVCCVLAACGSGSDADKKLDARDVESPLKTRALAGDREAQFQLGNSFCCGKSATLDTDEAIRWWCLAAIQDHPGALAALKKHDPRKTCPL